MSVQSTGHPRKFLVPAALLLALASTVGIRAYYRAAHLDIASGLWPRVVWFLASFALALTIGLVVQRIVEHFRRETSVGLAWALTAMTIAVLAMIGVECASTWSDRPVTRPAVVAHRLTNVEADGRFADCSLRSLLFDSPTA